jgi:hypothetical protein
MSVGQGLPSLLVFKKSYKKKIVRVIVFIIQDLTIEARVTLVCTLLKRLYIFFPSPAGVSLTKLSLTPNNFIIQWPGRVCLVTSRLGTGQSLIGVVGLPQGISGGP